MSSPDLPKTSWKREAPFRLGDLEVLPASGELRGRRGVERLRPLLMDILLRLAADPGEVVRRETLLEDVWPRRMVNDEVLSRAIAELRTALGDDARVARYIETLPKIGYRLVAPVEPLPAVPAAAIEPGAVPVSKPRARAPLRALGAIVAIALAALAWWMLRPAPADFSANLESRLAAARPFTSDPALELGPRFAPDGKRVAFALAEGNESRIVVQAIDGSSRQFVGGLEGFLRLSPVFFPDGRRIAYWKAGKDDCAIVEHDLESGLERKLLDCTLTPRSRFDLSRDGRWIVFSGATRRQFPAALHVFEVDRGPPRAITAPEPGAGDDLFPRFSPDGRAIAFFRGNESHRHPWLIKPDGSGAREAAKIDGLAYGFAWLGPEGPLLAAADWLGFRALNRVDLATGQAKLAGARGARFPDVGPRGEIVYENAVYSANLWTIATRGAVEPRALWRSTRYSSQPEFSPDGRSVTFTSNRDGADAIYVAPLDGDARRIAFGESQRYLRPHWSVDGRSIHAVRTTTDAGGADVHEGVRIPLDGSPMEVLASLGRAVADVREGADGHLYWGERAANAIRLMRAPVGELARTERLPFPLAANYQVYAGRLALVPPQARQLLVCRLDTLACEPAAVEVPEADLFHWALAARSVFLRRREDNTARIARYDLATRRLAESWPVVAGGAGSSIAVSPDESRLVYAFEDPLAVDLMLAR